MNTTYLKAINASHWQCFTADGITLFEVPRKPDSIIPIDCNTPSGFAWVLFDEKKQEITAARDYLGLEPFYYCYQNQTLFFASTIPDLIKQLPKHPELNVNRLLDECFHDNQMVMTNYSNETHYQTIFRLEAGSRLHIKNNAIFQEKYWFFERGKPTIYYANERDYIDHFGELLNNAVLSQIQGYNRLAAEYSGGLDSTAVLSVCHQHQIDLPLFCHVAGAAPDGGDFSFAECVIQHFNLKNVHYIDATQIELNTLFQTLAQIFAGVPPYIFQVMSNNVYQMIEKSGCDRVLSGFGGDQCVSIQGYGRPFFFELLQKKHYQQAWQEYFDTNQDSSRVNALVHLLRYRYPYLHTLVSHLGDIKHMLKSYLQVTTLEKKPRLPQHYDSIRELQVDLLEGSLCHEVRSRVEYSAVLGKAMGFSHAYPLLHPSVVDFALRIPVELKRRHGVGRYLIRQYLSQFVPEKNYSQDKRKGAYIMPAVMHKCREHVTTGQLDKFVDQLPFAPQIKPATSEHSRIRHAIFAYMINSYLNTL